MLLFVSSAAPKQQHSWQYSKTKTGEWKGVSFWEWAWSSLYFGLCELDSAPIQRARVTIRATFCPCARIVDGRFLMIVNENLVLDNDSMWSTIAIHSIHTSHYDYFNLHCMSYIFYIIIPVNPIPVVETNGLLINWSLVPSWVTGCRLLVTWLHNGYPSTGYHLWWESDSDFTCYQNTPTLISPRAQVIL